MAKGSNVQAPARCAIAPASHGNTEPPTTDAAFITPMAVGTSRLMVTLGATAMVVGKIGPRKKPSGARRLGRYRDSPRRRRLRLRPRVGDQEAGQQRHAGQHLHGPSARNGGRVAVHRLGRGRISGELYEKTPGKGDWAINNASGRYSKGRDNEDAAELLRMAAALFERCVQMKVDTETKK